jgi:hypothetical protein
MSIFLLFARNFGKRHKHLSHENAIANRDSQMPVTWASASILARGWGLEQLVDRLAEKS